MSKSAQKKFQEQRKQRMVAMRRRAQWQAANQPKPQTAGRIKKGFGRILDLLVMPYFYIMDAWINTLRDMFNVS